MTYIEFFDKNATENICSCLSNAPQRVILIGNDAKIMKKHIARFREIFLQRGQTVTFDYRTVPRNDLTAAMELLLSLLDTFDDCVFDITGGDSLLVLALGILREKYPQKNIQIHWFNLKNNTICDCDLDGTHIYREAPQLTAREHICIHGGGIREGSVAEDLTYSWDLNGDFLWDLEMIWGICKQDVRMWNIQTSIFAAVEAVGQVSDDGLTTRASISQLHSYMSTGKIRYQHVGDIVSELRREGLITEFREDGGIFTVSYKDPQVKRCLIKAGQVLEMKVYVAAKNATDKEGKPVYNDALTGVVMDWDGDLRSQGDRDRFDTENEIDVFLMHGVIPVFISCKNGLVTTEELYKLNTVAERFGGEYSKKALVATALTAQGVSGKHLRQRAQDMHIQLIENVTTMEDEEFSRILGNLWNN